MFQCTWCVLRGLLCLIPTNFTQSEMSIGDRERGPEVAINCSCLLFGVTLSYLITFGFTRMTNQISWVGR